MVADGRRYPGSDTGSAPCREVVTAPGDRDTESTVAGRKSSGVDGIRADATVVPLWTAADAAASSTATHPMGLERRSLFFMWETGSCRDLVPELE